MISHDNNPFSEREKEIINSGTENTPFRVLLIDNKEDSVLLRKKSNDIDDFKNNPDLELFIKRLKTTLISEDGVGIAAPQVGILKNIFLFIRTDLPNDSIVVVINPKIIDHPEETVCFENDGCLSVPETSGNSKRYPWIDVEYYNEKGEVIRERLEGHYRQTGFNSVVFQHEYDHLQGILFTDKLYENIPTE